MVSTTLIDAIATLNGKQRTLLSREMKLWQQRAQTIPSLPLREKQQGAALTAAQRRLFGLRGQTRAMTANNVLQKMVFDGPLEVALFKKSLLLVQERHPAFSTTFTVAGDEPLQLIDRKNMMALETVEWRGEAEAAAQLDQLTSAYTNMHFEPTQGPMFRAALVKVSDTRHVFLFCTHNLVFDAWSYSILIDDLIRLYNLARDDTAAPLPPPSDTDFIDYAAWQHQSTGMRRYRDSLKAWHQRLTYPHGDDLLLDRPRAAQRTYDGQRVPLSIPGKVRERLLQIGQERGATRFMTLLATVQGFLAQRMHMRRFCVGTINANRSRKEIEGVIGYFLNLTPIATQIDPQRDRFSDVLERAKQASMAAMEDAEVYLEEIVADAALAFQPNRNPYFDVLFAFENVPAAAIGFAGVRHKSEDLDKGTARYDLTFSIHDEPDSFQGWIEYNSALFTDTTAHALAREYAAWIAAVAAQPDDVLAA